MDHLLLPKAPQHPRIEVALANGIQFDEPFDTFPERHGWTRLRIINPDLHEDKIDVARGLLQEWLFFGFAQQVFGPLTQRSHWVRDGIHRGPVLSTSYLRDLIQRLHRRLKDPQPGDSLNWRDRIQQACRLSITTVNQLALQKSPLTSTNDVLAIAILCDTVQKSFGPKLDAFRASGELDFKVSSPIQAQMLLDGWCPREVFKLSHQLDLASFYLASNLNVPEPHIRHDECTKFDCTKINVNESKYVTRHDERVCDGHCDFSGVQQEALANILLSNLVPLISYEGDAKSGSITLVPATPGTRYVAISHVWSHGLGNPHENSVPSCQLHRISSLVRSLDIHSGFNQPLLWFDTICFPLQHEEAAKRALVYMRQSYADAAAVLVLDYYLESSERSPLLLTECLMRIIVSSWARRLWTLQEGALAEKLYFNFADGLIEMGKASLLHTAEMTKITCDGSLEYQAIESLIYETWEYWKTISSEEPRLLLNSLSNGLHWRATSVAEDEPLCLATLCGLDMEEILKGPEHERMAAFWRLFPALSIQSIFWSGPKLEKPGFRWAPSTFLHQSDAIFQDVASKSTLESTVNNSTFWTKRGLRFSCPGIFLNTWRANIGRHFWIRDQARRWYIFYRKNENSISFKEDGNDNEMQALVLIMKKSLEESFHGPSPEKSITCVAACIYDVDEDEDILYANTLGIGYLMPSTSQSATSLIEELVHGVEATFELPEAAISQSRIGTITLDSPPETRFDAETAVSESNCNEDDQDEHFFDVQELLNIRKDRLKARDEGDRISLDLGSDHLMFDAFELDVEQSWCLD